MPVFVDADDDAAGVALRELGERDQLVDDQVRFLAAGRRSIAPRTTRIASGCTSWP